MSECFERSFTASSESLGKKLIIDTQKTKQMKKEKASLILRKQCMRKKMKLSYIAQLYVMFTGS